MDRDHEVPDVHADYQDSLGGLPPSSQHSGAVLLLSRILERAPMCLRLLLREPTGRHTDVETRGFAWALSIPALCAIALIIQRVLYSSIGMAATLFALLFLIGSLLPIVLTKVFSQTISEPLQKVIYMSVRWAPISVVSSCTIMAMVCWSCALALSLPESGTPLFMMYVCACIATLQWSLPDLSARFLEKASTAGQPNTKLAAAVCDSQGQTFLHFPLCVGSAAGALLAMIYLSGRGTLYMISALLTARLVTYLVRSRLDPLHTNPLGFGSFSHSRRYITSTVIPAGAFLLWFFGIALLESVLGGASIGELLWGTIVFVLKLLAALALLTLPSPKHTSFWQVSSQLLLIFFTVWTLLI